MKTIYVPIALFVTLLPGALSFARKVMPQTSNSLINEQSVVKPNANDVPLNHEVISIFNKYNNTVVLQSKAGNIVTAPMYGRIVNIGQRVSPSTPVIIMEAMKMEFTIYADYSGTVGSILVDKEMLVEAGTPLITINP